MRVVFMGTPQFAADILEELARVHDVVCVYTRPDAVRGRGRALVPSEVAVVAEGLGVECRRVANFRDEAEVDYLAALQPDAVVVAAFGAILPKSVLEIPRFGCLNVHASLLPRWRGAAPVERAILAGDEFAGVCIMRMEEGLDTGDFCVRREIPVGDMSSTELTSELASLGSSALITALAQIEAGGAYWTAQDESLVTYANKIQKHELDLSPDASAVDNVCRVQASSEPHPAKCNIAGKTVRVLKVCLANNLADVDGAAAGDVVFAGKRLYLVCRDGRLEVEALQPAGKKPMDAKAFAAGNPDVREGRAKWSAIND